MENAIYFPYIKVPKNRWFTRILLYWNHVDSIVPSDFIDKRSTLGHFMGDLVQEGLVRQIAPAEHMHKIERFFDPFLEYIKGPFYEIPNDIESRKSLPTSRIHIEKMEPFADELIEMGLARRSPRPREHPWFEVESHTATLFMAYLASSLGELSEFKSEPITYNSKDFASVACMSPQARIGSHICENRTIILNDVLPAPNINIRPSEIAEFKEEYGKELIKFRNKLESDLNLVSAIQDPILQDRQLKQIIENTQDEMNTINAIMMARGWKTTACQLSYCIPLALSLILAVQKGDIAAEAIAAPPFLGAAYEFYRTMKMDANLRTNYAVYAVLAKKRWNQPISNNQLINGEEI